MLLIPIHNIAAQDVRSDTITFEFSIGGGIGVNSRSLAEFAQAAGTLMLGMRSRPEAPRARVYAFTVGAQGVPGFGGVACVPERNCGPSFNGIAHLAVLVGPEWRLAHGESRAMIGPAFFFGGGESGLGPRASLDYAMGTEHVEFLTALRGSYAVRFNGEQVRLVSFELGLRIQ